MSPERRPPSSPLLGLLVLPALLLAVGTAALAAGASPAGPPGGDFPLSPRSATGGLDPELEPLRRGALDPAAGVEAPFSATLDGSPLLLRLTAVPVLPGQGIELATDAAGAVLAHQAGSVRIREPGRWRWNAPEAPGAYALRLDAGGRTLELTALVLHPAERVRGGVLAGYRIGEYRRTPLRGDPAYLPPPGFVEVGSGDRDLLVSPRLTLGQLLCKQPGEPRFVALSPPLLAKLEAVMDRVEEAGHDPASMVVMSAFRTPAYNRAIGNGTSYSRHLWGDAADIYLDADGDGDMDDLDGNGRVELADARVLARLVEEAVRRPDILPGGLAVYRRNAVHGPFVHVDARGSRARW